MAATNPNDPIAKGPVTYTLDEISRSDGARARLDALRKAIIRIKGKDYVGLEQVFATHLFKRFYNKGQTRKITSYLKSCWFDERKGWWPAFQPVAPIYAEGLVKTLNAALRPAEPLPIDSYWVIGHGQVELINLVSTNQVTLLIATPPPIELAPKGVWSETSQAWVTARRAGRNAYEVDPTDNDKRLPARTELRVQTYKIATRKPKKA